MPTARITSKGQITIPRDVRSRLDLHVGDALEFVEDEHGYRIQKVLVGSPFAAYRGFLTHLKGRGPDDIVEEMRGR